MSNFNQIFQSFNDFNTKIIEPIKKIENNPIWLNDDVYSIENIYDLMHEWFGNEHHKFNTDDIFISSFKFRFMEVYPSFYFQAKSLNKVDLDNLQNEWFDAINQSKNDMTTDTTNDTEFRNSVTPSDILISDILDSLPLSEANKESIKNKLVSNNISESKITNGYQNYLKQRRANFNRLITDLLNKFASMFVIVDSDGIYEDGEYSECRFASGELVSEVDYLCQENLSKIRLQAEKIINNRTDINRLNAKVANIPNVEEMNSLVQDVDLIKQEQLEQDEKIKLLENRNVIEDLATGDNISIQKQGDDYWIDTTKSLNVESIGNNNGVLEIRSEAHFQDIPHVENGLIIDNRNLKIASTIAMLDNDLKFENANGEFILVDDKGAFSPRETKTLLNQVIEETRKFKPFDYVGEYDPKKTYDRNNIVSYKKREFLSLKDNNSDSLDDANSWVELGAIAGEIDLKDYYNKQQIDTKISDVNTNIQVNTNSIRDLTLKHQLNQQLINDVAVNHKLTIDPLQSSKWELKVLGVELDPTDVTKGTAKFVPMNLNTYTLTHSLKTISDDLTLVKNEINDMNTSTKKDVYKQMFRGVESKGSENNIGESFYGYNPKEFPNPIPLKKQVGVATFGNIFDVDYNKWNGILYNDIQIPFGTKNDGLGIDLTNDSFQSKQAIKNVVLYKNVMNDGVTKSYVDAQDNKILAGAKKYIDDVNSSMVSYTDNAVNKKIDKYTIGSNETLTGMSFSGKPVYCKFVYGQALGQDKKRITILNGIDDVIRNDVYISDNGQDFRPFLSYTRTTNSLDDFICCAYNRNQHIVFIDKNWGNDIYWRGVVYYTKL